MTHHSVTLSGPGTGKTTTLIDEVGTLIRDEGVDPQAILALTFTRAAANELREKLLADEDIGPERLPSAMTLHAFALGVLMSDTYRAGLPMPLRMLDDWECKNMLHPILARMNMLAGRGRIKTVIAKLEEYEAGWNSLQMDHEGWIAEHDPAFHKTLEELRRTFGFTLLGELPYKLRAYLRANPVDGTGTVLEHVFVDEYQDLNPCDQDIVELLSQRRAVLHVFGDDDQSIYSFREAAPMGIIKLVDDDALFERRVLGTCYRCPRPILELSQQLIRGTTMAREDKDITASTDGPCLVTCLEFPDGGSEVHGIISVVRWLHDVREVNWKDVLILVSGGRYGALVAKALAREGIPFQNWLVDRNPLDLEPVRQLYAVLRLIVDPHDALALWTWLYLSRGFGGTTMDALLDIAFESQMSFPSTLEAVRNREIGCEAAMRRKLDAALVSLAASSRRVCDACEDVTGLIASMTNSIAADERDWVLPSLHNILGDAEQQRQSPKELVQKMHTAELRPEIVPTEDRVRLMTMHKAKGLSSRAVIVPFLEDEVVLAKASTEAEKEERRRLIYVSITRAKEFLILTHARARFDQMAYTADGRARRRKRLAFFDDTDLVSEDGMNWVNTHPGF